MVFLDKLGWPVETIRGRPVLNFLRRCIHTRKIVRHWSPPSQGLCETTLTERFVNPDCRCDTYESNLGPCAAFEAGVNGRCVYCDHSDECHQARTGWQDSETS